MEVLVLVANVVAEEVPMYKLPPAFLKVKNGSCVVDASESASCAPVLLAIWS